MRKYILAVFICSSLIGNHTAAAVSVAVLDTGLDAEFAGLVGRVDPGIDLIDGALPAQDNNGHGSTVSRIIGNLDARNRVMPVRVGDLSASTVKNSTLVQGVNFAKNSSVRIMNLSLGSTSNTLDPGVMSSLKSAAQAGKFIALAAGNQGRANPTYVGTASPQLGGSGITVGALERNGDIASWSNRAGFTKNYYVLAPGYTSFNSRLGTSFATPRVSGTAAAILAQNPRLTANQLVEIILSTADDMGTPGVDEIYGHGRLNTQRALSAIGDVEIPDDSDDSSSGAGIALGIAAVSAGIAGAILYKKSKLKQTLVLDQYERPYTVDLGDLIKVRDDSLGLDSLMQSLKRRTEYSDLALTDNLTLGVWYGENDLQRFERKTTGQLDHYEQDWSLSLQQGGQTGAFYTLNMNLDPRQFFGAADDVSPYAVFDRRSLTAPYAGFAASGNMALSGYRTDNGHDLRLGVISMDDNDEYGVSSQSMLFEGSMRPHPRIKLGVQISALSEQGSLFGGSSGGAFNVDHAETLATGLLAGFKLTSRLSLQMLYSQGYTWVDDSEKSLLGGFSVLRSDSYAVGMQGRELFRNGDSMGISISRPLHINSGSLDLNVPGSMNVYTGEVSFDSESIDMSGVQRETDLELGYHMPVGKQTGVASYLRYRHDPTGILSDSGNGRYGVMMSVSSKF